MNISLKKAAKKAAITSIFLTGIASAFTLQAHESTDSINMDSASKEKTAMSMDMDMDMGNMKNMMGMMKMMGSKEQMEDMMAACTRMMQMTSNHHSQKEGEAKK